VQKLADSCTVLSDEDVDLTLYRNGGTVECTQILLPSRHDSVATCMLMLLLCGDEYIHQKSTPHKLSACHGFTSLSSMRTVYKST
jgi:hypothetical protein